jgi:hypothetical protein
MKQRPGNPQADSLYAHLQAFCPKASAHSLSQVVSLSVSAYLSDLGITEESFLRSVPNAVPSDNTLRNIVRRAQQLAYNTLAKELEKGTPFALAFDKGERAGLGRFVKEMTYFDHEKERVVNVRINSDGAKGKDAEAAEAIDCSLKDIDAYRDDGEKSRASGQCSDGGGGGGTKEGIAIQLQAKDRIDGTSTYYVATCNCHSLSKALQNAVENCFGSNGLGEQTFLQLIHTCWSAQEACGESFEADWKAANPGSFLPERFGQVNEEDAALIGAAPPADEAATEADDIAPNKLQKPVLTRWWHVNTCAWQVFSRYDEWLKFFAYQYESKGGSGSEAGKMATIATNGLMLIKSDKLKCDLAFFNAFSKSYWAKHMKWVHRIDEVGKIFGHSSRLMLVRMMLMFDELEDVSKMDDASFDKYKELRDALPADDHANDIYGKETAVQQAKDFFEEYRSTLKSNAWRWVEGNLLALAIGGTGPTATIFAQWICDIPLPDLPQHVLTYYDPSHGCEINLARFREFLDSIPESDKEEVLSDFIIEKHYDTIYDFVAQGIDIWSDAGRLIDAVNSLLKDICSYQVIIKHHTQSTEQGVQDIDLCTSTGRGEADASALSTYRSLHLAPVNAELIEACETRKKRANQHMGAGVTVEERGIRSAYSRRRASNGIPNAKPRADTSSKDKSRALISSAAAATPSTENIEKVRKIRKRKTTDAIDNSAKTARLKQNQKRKVDAEIKAANQEFKRPNSTASAENIRTATAKPPPHYTNDFKIKSVSRKDMVPLAFKELEARYGIAGLVDMGVCDANSILIGNHTKISHLKKLLQQWADADLCSCRGNDERSKCKCKKAEYIKLLATQSNQWKELQN